MDYIIYKGNCYSNLKINFSPMLPSADFFKILELIEFPLKDSENVLLKYALTELVTNSVRALNEKKIKKNVVVEFQIAGNFLKAVVTDFAGGFDLNTLPLGINEDAKQIDITSQSFQHYRERHGYNRFGIGLVSAKMALDAFRLVFIDQQGKDAEWQGEGSVAGTRIVAAKRLAPAHEKAENKDGGAKEGAFVRKNQRHSIFSKACINNDLEAYLIDISSEGIKLLLLNKNGLEQGAIISVSLETSEEKRESIMFCAVVRWMTQENAFWQIGTEFVRDAAFPVEHIARLVRAVEIDPHRLSGLVVIEGT